MSEPTTKVELTDAELRALDGQCRPDVQTVVEAAHRRRDLAARLGRLTPAQVRFVADVCDEAREKGRVVFRGKGLRFCEVCGRHAGYYRFKSGRRKGQEDPKRPLQFNGFEFADRFVTMRGYATLGCCQDCFEATETALVAELSAIRCETPEGLRNGPLRFKRWDKAHCTECDWRGHEGEMGRLRTLMGDGLYPGKCPNCAAQNQPFGRTLIKKGEGFVVVDRPA